MRQRGGFASFQYTRERGGERDGVLNSRIHSLSARRTVDVRRIAGQENSARFVVFGDAVVYSKTRSPDHVLNRGWVLLRPSRVEERLHIGSTRRLGNFVHGCDNAVYSARERSDHGQPGRREI